jgi:ATP-dependent DNA helicase RecG
MLLAVDAGFQAALMAPTQILAEQHYLQFQRLCSPLGIRVALRTGNRKEESGPLPLFDHDKWQQAVISGSPDKPSLPPHDQPEIVVGTHALLHSKNLFTRLGLAVIDEQHKFGVLQRATLRAQGRCPDMLVMTATPIPRTLTMSLYGDLDVSTLDELPKGRGKIITGVRDAAKVPEATKFIRSHLEAGRQAYIVYPLIEATEKSEAKAATAEFEKWETLLAPMKCGLLHGRIPPEEKEAVMERFRTGETKVLIATTVVEVGIDVPNATLMLIENADRFGLAQLHQLRGRVGRGIHKSYCILLTDNKDPEALAKLQVLERTSNGFDIAEADWEMRGPGDLLGTAQSGLPPLRIGSLTRDFALMQQARNAAFMVIDQDPLLTKEKHLHFRQLLAAAPRADLSQVS